MTNEIIHKLHYCIKGERKEKDLNIHFVSNWFHREFGKLIDLSSVLNSKVATLRNNIEQIDKLRIEQTERYKDIIKTYELENKEIVKDVEKSGAIDFVEKQIELINEIFESNSINCDDFNIKDFWSKCIEPQELMNLLYACETKDHPKKKAVAQVTK